MSHGGMKMKRDQEFIADVWNGVAKVEFEEYQKLVAKENNRRLKARDALIYKGIAVIFIVSLVVGMVNVVFLDAYFKQLSEALKNILLAAACFTITLAFLFDIYQPRIEQRGTEGLGN